MQALVKIYPSGFSQLVEGLDNIFRMPYGCFEQTSSTTYPNILALDYLRKTQRSAPKLEAKARQYIHLGYQRLVGFEVSGGGFDWFGRPPANRTLTAYGLMEFTDMARVHEVDPQLIARTRRWLLKQRSAGRLLAGRVSRSPRRSGRQRFRPASGTGDDGVHRLGRVRRSAGRRQLSTDARLPAGAFARQHPRPAHSRLGVSCPPCPRSAGRGGWSVS